MQAVNTRIVLYMNYVRGLVGIRALIGMQMAARVQTGDVGVNELCDY